MDSVWILSEVDMDSSRIEMVIDGCFDFEQSVIIIQNDFKFMIDYEWVKEPNKSDSYYIYTGGNTTRYELEKFKVKGLTNG